MNSFVSVAERAPSDGLSSPMPIYRSTKTYGHNEGLSCCFRQWRATHSHCRLLHGYALSFRFVFATTELDERNWCFDFGGLKAIRAWLHQMFDHTTLVAADDPDMADFQHLADIGLIDLRVMRAVGCEATAQHVFEYASRYIRAQTNDRVWLEAVEVHEHSGNSATYSGR
jgi:6-pyruvoyltetrahydropterin/6-carboxytetrahydropterin synthase